MCPRRSRVFRMRGRVLDDAVVDDGDPAGLVGVGMGVGRGRRAVGGPAGVADADGAAGQAVGQLLLQHAELARGLADLEAVAVHHRDARRVIAAVLEAPEPLEQQPGGLPGSDVADDATHSRGGLSARVLAPRRPALRPPRDWELRRSAGRSARCRSAGRGASGRARPAAGRPARPPRRRQSADGAGRTAAAARAPAALRLDDRVCRRPGHQLRYRRPSRGKEMQNQGHPQRRVAADVERRVHHPAVAFAADQRTGFPDGPGHVRLPHRSPEEAGPFGPRRILNHQAGRKVHDHGRRCRRIAAAPATLPGPRRRGCSPRRLRRPVSSTSARRSTSGSTASPMSAPTLPHQPAQLAQILRHRLGGPGEAAVGLQVDPAHPAAEPLEQRKDRDRSGAAHAVQRNLEPALRIAATSITGSARIASR